MGFFVFMLSGGVVGAFLCGPYVSTWGQVIIMDVLTLLALCGVFCVDGEILYKTTSGSTDAGDAPVALSTVLAEEAPRPQCGRPGDLTAV